MQERFEVNRVETSSQVNTISCLNGSEPSKDQIERMSFRHGPSSRLRVNAAIQRSLRFSLERGKALVVRGVAQHTGFKDA